MIAEKVGLGYMREIHEIHEVPGLLREIPDPPKILYGQGNIDLLKKTDCLFVCIVGPRNASPYGYDVTKLILEHLSLFNVIVVSGAAYGIDGLVHTLSLQNNIPTIAVPGSGISDESFYPKAHLELKHEIIDNGGLVVNEFHPFAKADVWTFPVRNRIMAGMCHLTIVVEAENKSGTLITAHIAADYNREVLAVPGSIFSATSQGTLELASKGAELFLNTNTLTETLLRLAKTVNICIFKKKQEIDKLTATLSHKEFAENTLYSLSPDETNIFNCIKSYGDGIDKESIQRLLNLSSSVVSICIALLELHGLVSVKVGKVWSKTTTTFT